MSNLGPQAIPAWRTNVPPRLVIVPDALKLVTNNRWTADAIHNMLRWTDISAATSNWHGIAIVTPTLRHRDIFRPSFLDAWRAWASDTKIRVVLEHGADGSDNFIVFGPPGAAATVTFFCKDFFTDKSSTQAWAALLEQMMPQCELNLDGRYQLEGWLSNGQIALDDSTSPQEIVVLRQQTQIVYPLVSSTNSVLPAAS